MRVAVRQALEPRRVERADDAVARAGCVLELRLEAVAHEQDELRRVDRLDVARRDLEVVRLGARRRQVLDVRAGRGDLLGRVGEGIEGRDDRRVPGRARGAAARDDRREQ